jgi:hypothetical protein
MQGEAADNAGQDLGLAELQEKVRQAEADAAARDAAAWAELNARRDQTPVDPPQPDPASLDQTSPEDTPEPQRPVIVGERGLGEYIESGPEKVEKEIFRGYSPEGG